MTSQIHPEAANNVKINGYAVFKGRPCKVVELSKAKPGKHGSAKIHFVGIDIFTGKKYDEICPSSHMIEVPDVNKFEMVLVDITEDGYLSLMSEDGKDNREDIKLPAGELGTKIKAQFDEGKNLMLTVQASMGEESIVAVKESKG